MNRHGRVARGRFIEGEDGRGGNADPLAVWRPEVQIDEGIFGGGHPPVLTSENGSFSEVSQRKRG